METVKISVVARGWEDWRMGKLVFTEYRISVGEDEKVLEMDYCGDNIVNVLNVTELYT